MLSVVEELGIRAIVAKGAHVWTVFWLTLHLLWEQKLPITNLRSSICLSLALVSQA